MARRLFSFPNPVNEVSARLVAGGVATLCLLTLVTRQPWLLLLLAYGFVARVATGPSLSPLGQFVTRVITPRVPWAERPVPGPPKRFAQAIGATLSVAAVIAAFGFGAVGLAWVLVAMILVAATLDRCSATASAATVRVADGRRIIPDSVCEECNDLSLRRRSQPVSN